MIWPKIAEKGCQSSKRKVYRMPKRTLFQGDAVCTKHLFTGSLRRENEPADLREYATG